MKIAIVGASGLVGRKMLEIIDSTYLNCDIIPYCSSHSNGKVVNGYKLKELNNSTIEKVDIALFSAGSETSKIWAKKFAKLGAFVIDNSNAFRRNNSVPLVVPEINSHLLTRKTKIIANPNCSTIQVALPLHYLSKLANINKVIISTYQSASGAGQKGLFDLENNTTYKFPHILNDDLIPHIDKPLKNGYTLEEDKMNFELKKILNNKNINISATCVRVPIRYCHGTSVYVEFDQKISVNQAKKTLSSAQGITLIDDLKNNKYPLTKIAVNTDQVYVGRIRNDTNNKKALLFWIVADNLRKGAASNAIQIFDIVKKLKQ